MKILTIESAALVASVALASEDSIIAEYTTNFKKTHSQTLMPMINEICRMTETDLESIDAIAVSKGPGSFTGLRIGAATAKGLGLALNKPVIPVSTLAAIAYNFAGYGHLAVPIMDARRDQVYTGIYAFKQEYRNQSCPACPSWQKDDLSAAKGEDQFSYVLQNLSDDGPVSIKELMEQLNAIGEDVIFAGDGVPVFREKIETLAAFPFCFAPPHQSLQKASSLAALAVQYYARKEYVDAGSFVPDYFRLSQAERERQEKEDR